MNTRNTLPEKTNLTCGRHDDLLRVQTDHSSIVAAHIAEAAPAHKTILVDAFAGVGGNAIAFARSGRWDRIFAIEKDDATLKCAKHNAYVYGVEKKIWWIKGDCFDVMKKQLKTLGKQVVIFGSPPWGGPGYRSDDVFNLETMQPYSLRKLYNDFRKISKEVVLYLPRTSDLNEVAELAEDGEQVPVTHYCMHGASKVNMQCGSK